MRMVNKEAQSDDEKLFDCYAEERTFMICAKACSCNVLPVFR